MSSAMGNVRVADSHASAEHAGLRTVLGGSAWRRLPAAVRERFAEPATAVDYVGQFEVVRASRLGAVLAQLCRLIGTPVVPRTGQNVAAVGHVGPQCDGVAWDREYRWPGAKGCLVRSTKVVTADGLVEQLPARLCMPLQVYERGGVLHFMSRGYYFHLGPRHGRHLKVWLPSWLSPGTHVQHIDQGRGWFRFTMRVVHPWCGELFYQTGRFRAAEEEPS